MRTLQFNFQPQAVKISSEEILADLNYPADQAGAHDRRNGRRPARRPRIRK